MEDERRALAAFVSKFDSLGLGLTLPPSKLMPPKPTPGGAAAAFAERRQAKQSLASSYIANVLANRKSELNIEADSPMRLGAELKAQPSLLEQVMPEEEWGVTDMSFDEIEVENQLLPSSSSSSPPLAPVKFFGVQKGAVRGVLGDKENLVPSV